MVRRVMIAALLVAAVFAVQGATSLAIGGAKLTITQTVSGTTDNISLTGSGYPANSTVSWEVSACDRSMGRFVNCITPLIGTANTDASGNFSTGTVASLPCGSNQYVLATAGIKRETPVGDNATKKFAC